MDARSVHDSCTALQSSSERCAVVIRRHSNSVYADIGVAIHSGCFRHRGTEYSPPSPAAGVKRPRRCSALLCSVLRRIMYSSDPRLLQSSSTDTAWPGLVLPQRVPGFQPPGPDGAQGSFFVCGQNLPHSGPFPIAPPPGPLEDRLVAENVLIRALIQDWTLSCRVWGFSKPDLSETRHLCMRENGDLPQLFIETLLPLLLLLQGGKCADDGNCDGTNTWLDEARGWGWLWLPMLSMQGEGGGCC